MDHVVRHFTLHPELACMRPQSAPRSVQAFERRMLEDANVRRRRVRGSALLAAVPPVMPSHVLNILRTSSRPYAGFLLCRIA